MSDLNDFRTFSALTDRQIDGGGKDEGGNPSMSLADTRAGLIATGFRMACPPVASSTTDRASVGMGLQILIGAVGDYELDDGSGIVRAILEDDPVEQVGTIAEDQMPHQFVDKGLSDLDARQIEHNFLTSRKDFLGSPARRDGHGADTG